MRFHAAGKVELNHIYTAPDPRAYFTTLRGLEYGIPQLAHPCVRELVERARTPGRPVTVVDIGCSYGINAALLRFGVTMAELYEHYGRLDPAWGRAEVVAADRAFLAGRVPLAGLATIGLDVSAPALSYARTVGLLDDAVRADLETRGPTDDERRRLAGADVVISTGCLGYVTARTVVRVVECARRRPLMAHTLLRMYPAGPLLAEFEALGYDTVAVEPLLRQRRFASAEEQALILDTLADLGVDPTGYETDGWLYARLFVSRPRVA